MSKHKTNCPTIQFLKVIYICVNLFSFIFMLQIFEIIFKRKLNTLVTKYTDILMSNFAHISYSHFKDKWKCFPLNCKKTITLIDMEWHLGMYHIVFIRSGAFLLINFEMSITTVNSLNFNILLHCTFVQPNKIIL